MKQLLRITILLLSTTIVACLPEVETIDPTTIVEWENYTTSNGLAGNQVNAITADSDGNLWIGTNNGVSKFDGTNFTTYRTAQGLIDNYVTSIIEFEPGVMVFGTDGGLSVLDNGSWSSVDFGTSYAVISMGVDSDGIGWVGTDVFGLIFTDGVDFFQPWDDQCYYCNFVNYMFLDINNTMWYGTQGGLKSLASGGSAFTLYTTSNGLPDDWVQSIYEDSWGTLWVGTYDGLCKRAGSGFETVSLYNSAPRNWTYTINQDVKHNNWFGTFGNGLIYSNGSSMRTDPETLVDESRSTLQFTLSSFRDNNGALWFGTFEGGLWKYIPK